MSWFLMMIHAMVREGQLLSHKKIGEVGTELGVCTKSKSAKNVSSIAQILASWIDPMCFQLFGRL